MDIYFNALTLKLSDILWRADHAQFHSLLEALYDRHKVPLRLKINTKNEKLHHYREFVPNRDFKALEKEMMEGMDGKALSAEISVMPQGSISAYERESDRIPSIAPNRHNQPTRRHPLHSAPMFFRRDGTNVDLIDIYQGSSVFLICNGQSFKYLNPELFQSPGIITFGVNNGAAIFRPSLWACLDEPIRFVKSIWEDPSIMKFFPSEYFEHTVWDSKKNARTVEKVGEFPNGFGFRRNYNLSPENWLQEETVNCGEHEDVGGARSVMLPALRIIHLLGFKKVYLVGCDFQMEQGHEYWFDELVGDESRAFNNMTYRFLEKYLAELQPLFAKHGFYVYNTNPNSKLRAFPFASLEEAISEAAVDTSQSTLGMYVDRK